jgi:hypothetical protein
MYRNPFRIGFLVYVMSHIMKEMSNSVGILIFTANSYYRNNNTLK